MKKNIVVFDGYCIMCSKYVLWLSKRNKTKNIYFTHFESKFIREKFPEIKLGNTVFVINENKEMLVRSKAIKHCINQTDINVILRFLFNLIPAFILDIFYVFISKIRYKIFGKKKSCSFPNQLISERILN
jgi:predicted DCC family thiol-disulfide oxidoreductase YuxK